MTKCPLGLSLLSAVLILENICISLTFRTVPNDKHGVWRQNIASCTNGDISEANTSGELDSIERIFAISDLHTDDRTNFSWLSRYCNSVPLSHKDALIIAGDISHELSTLRKTLLLIKGVLRCQVFFVPGNHEAWISGGEETSMDKLERVEELCREVGVYTDHRLVGADYGNPVWIVPMQSWYDDSLSLPGCENLTANFNNWPWTDFRRCQWPSRYLSPSSPIPSPSLTSYFHHKNQPAIHHLQTSTTNAAGLITFSHFLPSLRTLPDWKDVQADHFSHQWFDHGAPEISAKFAKVAGSQFLDMQLRSISQPQHPLTSLPPYKNNHAHIHVFGHSHRPKDFSYKGIRYIHNPLGKPSERELKLIDPYVTFQCIWDTTSQGMVHNPHGDIIRYWEERGGGKKALWENMQRRRHRRKMVMKRIMASL